MPSELDNLCQCGKAKYNRHCPHCGRINFYGLKDEIERPHPATGDMTTNVKVFRCRTCSMLFDDLQWQYECKARPSVKMEQVRLKEADKQTMIDRANAGEKLNDNDKRHFRKVVGMEYDLYIGLMRSAKKHELSRQASEKAVKILTEFKPTPMPVFKEHKLTPLQIHIENCSKCMANDEYCDVGKNLQIAETMEQP